VSGFRQDRTTGEWVLVAPERARRPGSNQAGGAAAAPPAFDPGCPFCPGGEHRLPGILEEMPSEGPPGWLTRVVPNRYPLLRAEPPGPATRDEAGTCAPAQGFHEVIVESPRHDADPSRLPAPELSALLRTYASRCRALRAQPAVEAVVLFRNHGRAAGASLRHPHAQIVASTQVPPRLAAARDWARAHHARGGRCATCEQLEIEQRDGRRIVEATPHFLAIVPFAARGPFETWIVPRQHEATFGRADDAVLLEFGRLLQRALLRLRAVLGDPPYNYTLAFAAADRDAAWSHWGLRLLPALATPGGFELATGLPVNPALPEADAETLRRASLPPPQADESAH
jgi:UDPglucose--hexose-1-phosphate uridylyltransferase